MNPLMRLKKATPVFLIAFTLVDFAILPEARALLPAPTPDGAYPVWNTAEGSGALFNVNVASGTFNTAVGGHALYLDTSGQGNTAVGAFALAANISGNQNVAVGRGALQNNTGSGNVAVGFQALFNNTTSGDSSQAFGNQALFKQRDGMFNNGFGWHALYNNIGGDRNTAIGHGAGLNITGSGNVDIGAGVGGVAGENNTTRIRNIGTTPLTGQMVVVDSTGKLGYVVSSRRYKEDIKPVDKDSEALFALKPVSFRYKGDIDPAHVKMFGLIAEEVAEVNPDLVVRNAKGEVDTIRFDSINAMLLNEFLKEHEAFVEEQRRVQEQECRLQKQETTIARQQEQIDALTAGLQKVTAQVATSTPSLADSR